MTNHLGSFEAASGKLVVSDPSYRLDEATGILDQVLAGTWTAYVDMAEVREWGDVCSKLTACHSSVDEQRDSLYWIKCSFFVDVKSGQAGIFDIGSYRSDDTDSDAHTDSVWYSACCNITDGAYEAGVMIGGVVSRAGTGNGSYGAYMAVNDQEQVIGVKIVFVKGGEW